MNRTLRSCAIVLALFCLTSTVTLAGNQWSPLAPSQPFATADETLNFINRLSLPDSIQFSCEFSDGSPATATYRVVPSVNEAADSSTEKKAPWQARAGFSNVEEARVFANAQKTTTSQFVACYNPNQNPASTSITVFYRPAVSQQKAASYRVYGTFPDAKSAADYINSHPKASLKPQFVPQFFTTQQVESSWSVISLVNRGTERNHRVWHTVESDAQGFPLQLETAMAAVKSRVVRDARLVATFSTASIHSRIVLFVLEDYAGKRIVTFKIDVHAALLGIPVTLNVDEELLQNMAPAVITDVAETGFEAFFRQTNIALWNEGIRTYHAPEQNPQKFAYSMPPAPNALNVFFSAAPLDPLETSEPRFGLYGEKFCIIRWKPTATKEELVSALIRALAHKFSAQNVNNPASAMHFDGAGTRNSWEIDERNLQRIRQSAMLAKRWNSVDIIFSLTK